MKTTTYKTLFVWLRGDKWVIISHRDMVPAAVFCFVDTFCI